MRNMMFNNRLDLLAFNWSLLRLSCLSTCLALLLGLQLKELPEELPLQPPSDSKPVAIVGHGTVGLGAGYILYREGYKVGV